MPTLILTPRFTADAQSLWRAATRLGWDVHRLSSWRITDDVRSLPDPVLYVEALFGPSIAAELGLEVCEVPEDWLPRLPQQFRKRDVHLSTLAQARLDPNPRFVKPPNDKSFPARVYTGPELPSGMDESMPVLVSEIVEWEKEFRCFVLDRQLKTASIYVRHGVLQRENDFAQASEELSEVMAFIADLLSHADVELPRAAVIDVGVIRGRGWAVVEQNAAWGAGIYGCDPEEVLHVLEHAAVRPSC